VNGIGQEERRGTMVTVRLLGNLTAASGEHVLAWELKEPTTLKQLLLDHKEEIPDIIKLWGETECMFTVGARIAADVTVVKDGDLVKITPHNSYLYSSDHPLAGTGGTQ
jgi:molybdopterin converting factor small subunit